MDFLSLKNISERYLEIINPTSREKLLRVGRVAGLQPGQRVIDFGCGYGGVLSLWAQEFGI
ncbi:MAG: class I SAM-dependent methyltransferase, partial [Chloroflexi bacterium]|nr:class I SAM-dependent methyltransferase [Chloroflexota bacterium]